MLGFVSTLQILCVFLVVLILVRTLSVSSVHLPWSNWSWAGMQRNSVKCHRHNLCVSCYRVFVWYLLAALLSHFKIQSTINTDTALTGSMSSSRSFMFMFLWSEMWLCASRFPTWRFLPSLSCGRIKNNSLMPICSRIKDGNNHI